MFAEFVVLQLQKVTFDVMAPRLVSPVTSVTVLVLNLDVLGPRFHSGSCTFIH